MKKTLTRASVRADRLAHMTIEAIRQERLQWLLDNNFKKKGKTAKDFAVLLGVSPAQVSQWLSDPTTKGHRNISTDTARKIEQKTRMPREWLDGRIEGSSPTLSPMAQRLGRAFDEVKDQAKQNALFVEILNTLEKAAIEPAPVEDQLAPRPKNRRGART